MLINFFTALRRGGVPVSLRELLDLLEALQQHLVLADADGFYQLSRAILVKDEKFYDRFDRAFARYFSNLESLDDIFASLIPEDWLRENIAREFSDEEKAQIESLGGFDALMEAFRQRLEEQTSRHEGGSKWIGTGGTSPFGHSGYNPEGIRVGGESRNQRATKVWEKREFRDLDDSLTLGTRNIKVALRRLRKFARDGAAEELDLDDTISSTARNAGLLDIKMVAERHNAVKLLLFLDVGGSMDPHIRVCEELFSAASSEFKHLEYFYFHNFIYESVWRNNVRREQQRVSVLDIIRTYSADYKVVIVGDAAMSPYEIVQAGGSVEHWNDEAGAVWMGRLSEAYRQLVWLNPLPEARWERTQSVGIVNQLIDDQMYPLNLQGLERCISYLAR